MELPLKAPQVIEYTCNICGGKNRLDTQYFHRELATCRNCGANARFRGIIHVLGNLLGESGDIPLEKWPRRKHVFGVGMSDWSGYANLPRKNYSYENTFYDHKP